MKMKQRTKQYMSLERRNRNSLLDNMGNVFCLLLNPKHIYCFIEHPDVNGADASKM